MTIDLISGIVPILKSNDETPGTGFILTDDGLIATCAHLIDSSGAGPGDIVRMVFTLSASRTAGVKIPTGWCTAIDLC